MTYQRVRGRNAPVHYRPRAGEGPYPVGIEGLQYRIIGDLNRMEQDYLDPAYPEPPGATRPPDSDPATECALALGIDVELVRSVLRYVLMEQR